MEGCLQNGDTVKDWRKAKFVRNLPLPAQSQAASHCASHAASHASHAHEPQGKGACKGGCKSGCKDEGEHDEVVLCEAFKPFCVIS